MSNPETPAAFSLCGGHPALDFVNTLDNRYRADGPTELLRDYSDLARFMEQTRLLSSTQVRPLAKEVSKRAAEHSLQSALELREAAAAAFYGCADGPAPKPADLRILERHVLDANRHQELCWKHPGRNAAARPCIEWGWGRFESEPQLPVWLLAQQISALMTSAGMRLLRACAIDSCRWLFLDTSRNHSRRWCDMQVCGNRMKARRFQARRSS
jgi:predicted RNA-binding Zn ribbon-like protein